MKMSLQRVDALPDLQAVVGGKRPRSSDIIVGDEERDPTKCIFVGGLANDVTELLLFELFTQVCVCGRACFCFVPATAICDGGIKAHRNRLCLSKGLAGKWS